jgi:hypothetical protein
VGYEAISTTGVVAWYRQPANPTGTWSETLIAQVTGPMSLDVADMDRDGDLDVVVGEHDLSSPGTAGLFVFENADGAGGSWTKHTVYVGDEHHDGAQVVDIDRDGDFDIVSIGWGHGRVLLYENKGVIGGGGDPDPDPDPDPDLIAAYGFVGSATPVTDTSGNGNMGYMAAGATRSELGHTGKALETDGINGHVDLGGLDIPSGELTMMAWVNADDFGTPDARILSKSSGTASDDHVWMLSTIEGNHARFRLKTDDGGSTTTLVGTGDSLVAGNWHHIAATYDGATMRLYQDGNEVGSTVKTGAVSVDPAVTAYIAANPGSAGQVFDGRIDDVKVFGRALTVAEIASEMDKPADASSTTTAAGCYFDEELGKTLCPRSCTAGPIDDARSTPLLWLAIALLAFAARSFRRRTP